LQAGSLSTAALSGLYDRGKVAVKGPLARVPGGTLRYVSKTTVQAQRPYTAQATAAWRQTEGRGD